MVGPHEDCLTWRSINLWDICWHLSFEIDLQASQPLLWVFQVRQGKEGNHVPGLTLQIAPQSFQSFLLCSRWDRMRTAHLRPVNTVAEVEQLLNTAQAWGVPGDMQAWSCINVMSLNYFIDLYCFILFHNSTVLSYFWYGNDLVTCCEEMSSEESFFLSVIRQSSTFDQQLHMGGMSENGVYPQL